ncbi:uncharacterized protein LOC130674907 [Microplitis mediator]|uniref:uncharacterized protein LOC130674907 n=1 Tax=Microplitis mediator TaxID=375433 RepID=UPI0025556864|nr:uncharacterized protein LOC130674907 [Microplitis mediator]XP_057336343.1 uncharacterized protein LOC130674907 [Microplitis mediator]
MIICGTCDLPAKATFLNMKGHTGIFGCCHCKIQSKYFNKRRIYPFKKKLQTRTTKESIKDSKKAIKSRKSVNGIKGHTVSTQIVHDVFNTTVVDIMHCVYLGVVKKLFSLWFDNCNSNNVFSLHDHLSWVDSKIRSIFPPGFVSRLTRSVNDYKYWKASEWKQWLLHYSIPILSSIMTDQYLEHHKLLVTAISYLSYISISKKMISVSFTSIKIYIFQFKNLYGLTHMTCNLHSLYHLPDVVRKFGPLPVTSCFAYEDLNGSFRRLVQGTRYAQLQICSALSVFNNIIEVKSEAILENTDVTKFCKKVELFHLRNRKLVHILDKCFIIGIIVHYYLSDSLQIIFEGSNIYLQPSDKIYRFTRLFKNNLVYESELYKRKKKTNSSIVVYNRGNQNNIGIISEFIKVCFCQDVPCSANCINSNFFAVIIKCSLVESNIPDTLIDMIDLCVKSNEPQIAINIKELITVCFRVNSNDETEPNTFFVARPVNLTEIE